MSVMPVMERAIINALKQSNFFRRASGIVHMMLRRYTQTELEFARTTDEVTEAYANPRLKK